MFAGLAVTAAMEWIYTYGPRVLLPEWTYPFLVKLPLVTSCVLLLECSRRAAAATVPNPMPILKALERCSLGVLLLHEGVEVIALKFLPMHMQDASMLLYQLPALLFWSWLAASVLVWTEEPFRLSLDQLLRSVHSAAMTGHASMVILIAVAVAATVVGVRSTCAETWPNPCHL
eukprot:gnl/TRDRNA2_/TRDRNA2_76540_c2_seq1.p1 gnl/TRDRNA2_/TRDRNA2_76540_c2~~gnl/TRDRNA2_/TRDRNA2_76540_c2_seq1.p1  ORF type:complete len:201 (+),score=25.69 gnl/TRDRNA2_/TRDRNA2_76540_c2_seq1:84-605(+)